MSRFDDNGAAHRDTHTFQERASREALELHQAHATNHHAAQPLHEQLGGLESAARCQQVIYEQHCV